MKIAVFTDYFLPENNGLVQYVYNLYKELMPQHEIHIITFGDHKKDEIIDGFHVHRFKGIKILGGTYTIPCMLSYLSLRLKKYNFDLVNTNTRFFMTSYLGAKFAKKNKIRHIHTEHGTKFVPHKNKFVKLMSRIVDKTIGKYCMSKADLVCPVAKEGINFAKKMGAKEVKVIYNGISKKYNKYNATEMKRLHSKYLIDKKQINIIYVGRLIEGKGVQDLINALKYFKKPYRLYVVGDGNYKLNLMKLCFKLGTKVRFLGYQNRDFILNLESQMSVFVNPSYAEGFPTSVLEAGLVGLPVIATDVGGTKEMVGKIKNLHLIKPKDSKAMLKLLENIDLKKSKNDLSEYCWIGIAKEFRKVLQ